MEHVWAYPKIPALKQDRQTGLESEMRPSVEFIRDSYKGSGKMAGKVALVSGGDSGIRRAAALHFAREGDDVAIMYLDEHEDAEDASRLVEAEGRRKSNFCYPIGRLGRAPVALAGNRCKGKTQASISFAVDDCWAPRQQSRRFRLAHPPRFA